MNQNSIDRAGMRAQPGEKRLKSCFEDHTEARLRVKVSGQTCESRDYLSTGTRTPGVTESPMN